MSLDLFELPAEKGKIQQGPLIFADARAFGAAVKAYLDGGEEGCKNKLAEQVQSKELVILHIYAKDGDHGSDKD